MTWEEVGELGLKALGIGLTVEVPALAATGLVGLCVLMALTLEDDMADEDDYDWSRHPECELQYNQDRAVCQRVKKRSCWASLMERLAYCNRTEGQTGFPPLITR